MEALQNLLQPVTRMQWTDYLDILLVAFLIYRLLPLIRTPNTMRVAKAVVVVMVILGLAEVLHLYAMSFILNQFLSIGLIALVVLFQPELRRMLEQPETESVHHGLRNVSRRLELQYGEGSGLFLESIEGSGFTVTARLRQEEEEHVPSDTGRG